MSDQEQSAGKARRTQVMGAPFVERAMNGLDGFNRPLQEWLNEHAWGSTWLREGIDLKTRSLCTCAMLAALGKSAELKGHIRGAINNGAASLKFARSCCIARSMRAHRQQWKRFEVRARFLKNWVFLFPIRGTCRLCRHAA